MSNDIVVEQNKDGTTLILHEDLFGRLVKAEERVKEAETRASEATKEVSLNNSSNRGSNLIIMSSV